MPTLLPLSALLLAIQAVHTWWLRCWRCAARAVLVCVLSSGALHAAPAEPQPASSPSLERVTLQLKWLHQFQFAGYYAAQARGFYRDEGLDVTIKEGGGRMSQLAEVLAGRAQFAVGDADLLVARIKGQPIVAMAALFQHSPYVLLSRADSGIRSPHDLVGKKVMLSGDQGEIQMRAMLQSEGIAPSLVTMLPQTWNLEDLIEGRVDAMSAYATVEPGQLARRGVEAVMMRSADFGVDFYGDILFTSEEEAERKPERTEAFLRASLRGWVYALEHRAEIADLILALPGARERGLTRESLLTEADAMRELILPDVVDVGHMSKARFENIAGILAAQRLVPADYSLDGWVFERDSRVAQRLWRLMAWIGGVFMLVVVLVLVWNRQIQRRVHAKTRELRDEVRSRSRVEQELKLSQELVQLLFGTAASGLVMNTPGGYLLMANPAYCTMLGYSLQELELMDTRTLTHPDDSERYGALRERMLAGEFETFTSEKRYVKKSGDTVWVRAKVSLVRAADGQPTHVIAVTDDITESRAIAERLQRSEVLRDAEREKASQQILLLNADLEARVLSRTAELESVNAELKAFSYSVSHDLRAPLNTIDGFVHLLARAEGDRLGDKGKHYLSRIRNATREMVELIDGLLSLAQVSRGELQMRDVDLSALVQGVLHKCQERDPQRAVTLLIEPGLHAEGDPMLLSAVLNNLLENAWKFTSKADAACIAFGCQTASDAERVFFVKDNGAGFDMAAANRLFSTFERLHAATDFAGTGVGLSIVKRVIERHGGRVWAYSEVGEGATFFFALPTLSTLSKLSTASTLVTRTDFDTAPPQAPVEPRDGV